MGAFFLAIVLYPEVQAKAQAELDQIVGCDRLPNFSDRPHLPYLNALVKELIRWWPAILIGLPHRVTAEDEYKGFLIPAGATVFANIWCVIQGRIRVVALLMSYLGPFCVILTFTRILKFSILNVS